MVECIGFCAEKIARQWSEMIPTILISAATCLFMILSILFFPKVRIGRLTLDTYWPITLGGAVLLMILGLADPQAILAALTADTAVNPVKILVLFLSMTLLSVFLDELGFFRYLASCALKRARGGQVTLFLILYLLVSVLTVFTSNDVIILSFTPFICYFAKSAGISPMPYLAAEFVAANTWSMALVIGNPTNIYLATGAGITFLDYLRVMLLPTLLAGTAAFIALFLLFRRRLTAPIEASCKEERIEDKPLFILGIAHLGACTVLLAVGSYIGLAMWLVSLCAVISLFACVLTVSLVRRLRHAAGAAIFPRELRSCLMREPWQLAPFVLSMFVLIVALSEVGATDAIAALLGKDRPILAYGAVSFLSANLVNNIPMSVLFERVIPSGEAFSEAAVYATVIGSNLGAFLTPIGALAGIMFSALLAKQGLRFGYLDFLKIGITVAIPTLAVALLGLSIVL